ncbi:PLC-like phosphodiesterase [Phycomyces blakesleeanus]|uniref:PLC-like phosphodiesterase n=1 Tax=Phycomyces blakesleeanus TaxID=4837 RepID=A0ABR3BIS6_PHYBL
MTLLYRNNQYQVMGLAPTSTLEKKIPDVIAHRGYSGKYPENTLISYEEALRANTTALEGDIRLSKDGEVVIMHDLTLQRTSTGNGAVFDHNWVGYIDGLFTKTEPPQPIPRLKDVFDILIRPDVVAKNTYMIVDIKFDNQLEILDAVQVLLEEYKAHTSLRKQLVFGIWDLRFLERAKQLFIGYQLCFIGLSLGAARKHFLHELDNISLPYAALVDQEGQDFIKEAHSLGKRVFCWTINNIEQMHQCVAWGLDGVIGDNVDTLIENVRTTVNAMSPEEFEKYVEASNNLMGKRSRLYYYIIKKSMSLISWKFIGI